MVAPAARRDDIGLARNPTVHGVRNASRGQLDRRRDAVCSGTRRVQRRGVLVAEALTAGALGWWLGEKLSFSSSVRTPSSTHASSGDPAVAIEGAARSTIRATASITATPGPVSKARTPSSWPRRGT